MAVCAFVISYILPDYFFSVLLSQLILCIKMSFCHSRFFRLSVTAHFSISPSCFSPLFLNSISLNNSLLSTLWTVSWLYCDWAAQCCAHTHSFIPLHDISIWIFHSSVCWIRAQFPVNAACNLSASVSPSRLPVFTKCPPHLHHCLVCSGVAPA